MAKAGNQAALSELPLNDERKEVKRNRHVVVALRHMEAEREALTAKIEKLTRQRDDVDAAIEALK